MSLTFQGVSVDVGQHRIVHDVDLVVPDGAFVGLLGPNGSGKSTLLSTTYRLRRPSTGAVLVDGSDLLALRPRHAARRVAVLTQESPVELDLAAGEMVALGLTAWGRTERTDEPAVVGEALDRVGCAHLVRRSYLSLSGGEKQRVLLARAVAQGADHLVLDEPTNHLDIRYQVEVLELVASLGLTVLAALHDLSLAALFCDQVVLLADGRVVTVGTPAEVLTTDRVAQTYAAHVVIVPHPETAAPQPLASRTPRTRL